MNYAIQYESRSGIALYVTDWCGKAHTFETVQQAEIFRNEFCAHLTTIIVSTNNLKKRGSHEFSRSK